MLDRVQVVLIGGSEFGSAADTVGRVVVTYGPAFFPSRFVARNCYVDFDFNSITCVTAPGTGKDHVWIVRIDGNASPVNAANTSYGAPIVATYAGNGTVRGSPECFEGVNCGNTRGDQIVSITGQNFGSEDLGNELLVRYVFVPGG